jgi:hypothetical protein
VFCVFLCEYARSKGKDLKKDIGSCVAELLEYHENNGSGNGLRVDQRSV